MAALPLALASASSSSSLLFSNITSSPSIYLSCITTSSLSLSLSLSLSSSSIYSSVSPLLSQRRRSSSTSFTSSSGRLVVAAEAKKKVLIVNTDSGGHAVIGFYFAKELLGNGHSVTILTVGEETSSKMKKPPFSRFSEIVSGGGKTVWGDPAEIVKVVGADSYDVVLDNNGKDLDTVRPVIDWAKSSGVKQFMFISSAGIYKPTEELPHLEGEVVKASAGHVGVEQYISVVFESWAIFRPQYMIGSGNNKDCEEWFFDRIVRDRPVPIPGSGMQLTNIAHVSDLSSMLTLVVENPPAASRKIFNCVSDRAITLDGMAKLCALAAGKPVNIVHYDPESIGADSKKAFPFRNMHFYAEPRLAKDILGWKGTTNLPENLKERYEEYVKIGRDKKQIEFPLDDKILESLKVPVTA